MHQCDEFRERITEHIIDRKDCSADAEFRRELLVCSECSEFYTESREMIEAISSVDFEISEDHLNAMAGRLRFRLQAEGAAQSGAWKAALQWREVLAVAALLLVTIGLYRVAAPKPPTVSPDAEYEYVDQSIPLDPVTVDFLEESELLLRHVMKIAPSDAEDLADAKRVAARQLAAIDQRKAAAAGVPPAVNVMDTYETILRDIRNANGQGAAEDISDIQNRIQNNALIANMKAFQPTVSVVSIGLR